MFTSSLFSFQGRLRRSEWWLIRLVVLGALVAAVALVAVVDAATGLTGEGSVDLLLGLVLLAGFAVVVWIELAAGVKRLHDQDLSGWMIVLILIPGVGALFALIVLGILDGTAGPNDYGPSAKYPDRSRLAAMLFD